VQPATHIAFILCTALAARGQLHLIQILTTGYEQIHMRFRIPATE